MHSKGVDDAELAGDIHRILSQHKGRIPIDDIPTQYQKLRGGRPFPYTFTKAEGLANLFKIRFKHVVSLTQNRQLRVFAEAVFPPDTPTEYIKQAHHAVATGKPVPPPPPRPTPEPILVRALHRLLVDRPDLGQATSLLGLRDSLSIGFYELWRIPLQTDPIQVIEHSPTVFSPILQGPGMCRVRTLDGPDFAPPPPPSARSVLLPLMTQIRDRYLQDLALLDSAITRIDSLPVPDPLLWREGLQAVLDQGKPPSDILNSLFSQ
jgi:hypothetical protein